MSRLRRVLATAAEEVRIPRQSGSYVLTVDSPAVDLHRFRGLVGQARAADDSHAAVLFAQALALWRGDAFGDLDTPWFNVLREPWHRERLATEPDLKLPRCPVSR
ncbi:BTAD domain-containing putative transcriptional regulator [Streptomyces sp. ML-6]|uniref:AfsR/SARP family transcriptional regulator n=1 Tax=Streptomyces sp. ML-6 TaxID=2982693 RepID=UPI0024C0615B|nr:BTAD domain-containing putative transcriptional regulator [Streptomyces sp. ML-6]MDK0518198.1 hypothetical protein [Streptomyces sp. ML-6]